MTSLRGMQEDHVGADRAFHEITVHAHQANPGLVAGTDPAASPLAGQGEPRRPSRSGASAAGIAHAHTGSTGRLGRQDVVRPLVDKPWSDRVGGHPVDTPAV